ncbi:hypothetical protein H0H92_014822 [Tricholoma furcatifolium]|nr:hypothetical protein H0H92_014822 [Tricholoma furcatifolium]
MDSAISSNVIDKLDFVQALSDDSARYPSITLEESTPNPKGRAFDIYVACILLSLKPNPGHPNNFWSALLALERLRRVLLSTRQAREIDPFARLSVRCAVRDNWAAVWKWVECAILRVQKMRVPIDNFATSVLNRTHYLIGELSGLGFEDEQCERLYVRGIPKVIDLWFWHTKVASRDMEQGYDADALMAAWLVKDPNARWEFVVKRTGHSSEMLTKLVHERSRRLLMAFPPTSPIQSSTLNNNITLLGVMTCLHSTADPNAIQLYTHFLVHISKGLAADGSGKRRQAVEGLFFLLLRSFEGTVHGIPCVRRAIEAGLILGILQSMPLISMPIYHVQWLCELVKCLVMYTTHLPVLRALVRSIKKRKVVAAFRVVQDFTFPCQARAWLSLMWEVMEKRALKSVSHLPPVCSRKGCRRVFEFNTFKRCAGCECVYYCSVECQSSDWSDGGHRSYCKNMMAAYAEDRVQVEHLLPEDIDFLKHFITQELNNSKVFTRADLRSALGLNSHCKIGHSQLSFNYVVCPPTLSISDRHKDGMEGYCTITGKFPFGKTHLNLSVTFSWGERPLDVSPIVEGDEVTLTFDRN